MLLQKQKQQPKQRSHLKASQFSLCMQRLEWILGESPASQDPTKLNDFPYCIKKQNYCNIKHLWHKKFFFLLYILNILFKMSCDEVNWTVPLGGNGTKCYVKCLITHSTMKQWTMKHLCVFHSATVMILYKTNTSTVLTLLPTFLYFQGTLFWSFSMFVKVKLILF